MVTHVGIPSWLVSLSVFPSYSSCHDWSPLHSSLIAGVVPYHPSVAAVTMVMTSSVTHCITTKYNSHYYTVIIHSEKFYRKNILLCNLLTSILAIYKIWKCANQEPAILWLLTLYLRTYIILYSMDYTITHYPGN